MSVPILSTDAQARLSTTDKALMEIVDGSGIFLMDKEIENLSRSYLAYRSAGSAGANASADWISGKFNEFGVQSWTEEFSFASWDMLSKPSLVIDVDGDLATNDSVGMSSFGSEQWSWPTPLTRVDGNAVVLPLPEAGSRDEIGRNPIDVSAWNSIVTTGKVVFIGREVRWDSEWQQSFHDKIVDQKPSAIVLIWWYDWMDAVDVSFYPSSGGLLLGSLGPYFWDRQIPVGHLNLTESELIKSTLMTHSSIGDLKIDSHHWNGIYRNVIGKINGSHPGQKVIVSAHYDSVLDPGFCDNGGGIASLLELSRVLGEAQRSGAYTPFYDVLFIAFAGEELGLVGSAEYVKEHISDLPNILAVISIDCIGSERLMVSTDSSTLNLMKIVLDAASDLEVGAAEIADESSDQRSFSSPSIINQQLQESCGVNIGINDATPVPASVTIA